MSNHEQKDYADYVDVYLALSRTKDGQPAKCMRVVAKYPDIDLAVLELRCQLAGGKWRIHKTVNARDTEKARKWLLKKLIDFPEGRGFIDSLWRTALLQPECVAGEKKFLLDIDSKDPRLLAAVEGGIAQAGFEMAQKTGYERTLLLNQVETENGWHYITAPFDTRVVLSLPSVSLQRDGYVYVKTVGASNV
jgi:hypothetical protein